MYSIWLMPSRKEFERYDDIIKQLGQRFEAPIFEPHITLFTGIPSLSDTDFHQISVLAALTTSFDITLDILETSDIFHKALFLNVNNSPELDNFSKELSQIFPNTIYDFKPHFSLLYHQLSADDQRELKATFDAVLFRYFEATSIKIVQTKGDVHEWRTVETFPLNQADNISLDLISEMVSKLVI